MIQFEQLKNKDLKVLAIGNHPQVLQAMLDFDYLAGKSTPVLQGIVQSSEHKKLQKFFWGKSEIMIPIYHTVAQVKTEGVNADLFINLNSARRVLESTIEFFEFYPEALGGHIFAEEVPEQHAVALYKLFGKDKIIAGPSGVGILLPGYLKLGAIGGTDIAQIVKNKLVYSGNTAIVSASGGMANEIINILARNNIRVSLAFTVGGDRFPVNSVKDTMLRLQSDKDTEFIVYYGELGGLDEYELIDLIQNRQLTKKIIAYISGRIDEAFDKPAQFGHAKALAANKNESAQSKIDALKKVGVLVGESFEEFINLIKKTIPAIEFKDTNLESQYLEIKQRRASLFTSSISNEKNSEYYLVGESISTWVSKHSLGEMITTSLLGHKPLSSKTSQFIEIVVKSFLDHGPQVSGGVNTIIAARAGKDIVSSVAAGLLTIGPRFGGATNESAHIWYTGIHENITAKEMVNNYAKIRKPILGIGHLKYRIGMPDPRVQFLVNFAKENLKSATYLNYALEIEKLTSSKKGNLILNVDGTVAAIILDILSSEENYSPAKIAELINIEFFNALFLIARTIGFSAHYLDQKRNDEGLFRLPDELVNLSGPV